MLTYLIQNKVINCIDNIILINQTNLTIECVNTSEIEFPVFGQYLHSIIYYPLV